jgi:hypothetical protein
MRKLIAAVLFLCLGSACASQVLIPPEERGAIERDLSGSNREKHLRLSYYVTPFFGDEGKRLLTPVPPDEVRLLNEPNGSPVSPGAVQKILPAGTKVRITKIEFPTSFVMAERILYTPRHQPWVYLQADGEPKEKPLILVLRPKIRNQKEFMAELERYLSNTDLSELFSSWSDTVRDAVKSKMAIADMPAEALEMAWGYPERKKIALEETGRSETWIYADGKKTAVLIDGRVNRLEGSTR